MARPCSVCHHPKRTEIDAAIVAGAAFRTIAERYEMSHPSLIRHRNAHLSEQLAAAVEARAAEAERPAPAAQPAASARQTAVEALDVLAQLKAVNGATLRVLQDARSSGDGRLVLARVGLEPVP